MDRNRRNFTKGAACAARAQPAGAPDIGLIAA